MTLAERAPGESCAAGSASGDRAALARLLGARHSCRAYLPDPLARAEIEGILELAPRTPSWYNTQPWEVVVTDGEGPPRSAERWPSISGWRRRLRGW